ncbi:MAG: hypothetical protein JG777_576 [Clostridia bacterium]|nr:hypothetical protein [Clostridia bacterium]
MFFTVTVISTGCAKNKGTGTLSAKLFLQHIDITDDVPVPLFFWSDSNGSLSRGVVGENEFTFHYGPILTCLEPEGLILLPVFTFHYGPILTLQG